MLEACAIAHSQGMEWLEFITCMYANYNKVPTSKLGWPGRFGRLVEPFSLHHLRADGQACATKARLPWTTLSTCYGDGNGAEGKRLIAVRA